MLVCRIEMKKDDGIVIQVDDESGNVQEAIFDGSSITLKVKGPAGETTIFQDDSEVRISCSAFTLQADTIACSSTGASNYVSQNSMKLESLSAFEIKSMADLTQTAMGNVKLATTAGQLNLETGGIATLKGSLTQIKGKIALG